MLKLGTSVINSQTQEPDYVVVRFACIAGSDCYLVSPEVPQSLNNQPWDITKAVREFLLVPGDQPNLEVPGYLHSKSKINLGDYVRDPVTKIEGYVIHRVETITGDIYLGISYYDSTSIESRVHYLPESRAAYDTTVRPLEPFSTKKRYFGEILIQ